MTLSEGSSVLPTEIWLNILEHTTPTAFIAFSQSCRGFRRMTMPDRYHFLLRLLELELDPIIGGGIPTISEHGLPIPTLLDDEGWASIKYVCAGCLKLKSHRAFDNHTVLSLRQRKPLIDAPAAQLMAEPGDIRTRMRRFHAHEGASRQVRVRRDKPTPKPPSRGFLPENKMTKTLWEQQGTDRHRRLCIDCMILRARVRDQIPPASSEQARNDEDSNGGDELDMIVQASPTSMQQRRLSPVMQSCWSSEWASNDMRVTKDMLHSMGSKWLRCPACCQWRPLLSFVVETPAPFQRLLSWHRSKLHMHKFAGLLCFDCVYRVEIEAGVKVAHSIFARQEDRLIVYQPQLVQKTTGRKDISRVQVEPSYQHVLTRL